MPLSLCIVSQLQMRHGNQIEIKIPACCWQSWAGACGLDLRLESVLLLVALQVYIWRPPEVKMRSAELSVTQLVRGVKTVFHSHPPLASSPTHTGTGAGAGTGAGLALVGPKPVCLLSLCRSRSRTLDGLHSTPHNFPSPKDQITHSSYGKWQ